jgi:hypothetical protein
MGDATFLDSQLIGIERWLRQTVSNAKTSTART